MGAGRVGEPESFEGLYQYGFGTDAEDPLQMDLEETYRFCELLPELGIKLLCTSAGSPYYNPHIQRPALFPPSDGYLPPEDPLAGVARQLKVTRELKSRYPELCIVGSGYTYLQEWLPAVAQYEVRTGGADFVGLGRLVLSYHDLPADVLAGRGLQAKRLCRTFSDCTTGPRNGLVSGCFPLDPFYRDHADAAALKSVKEAMRQD
jgi:NADPH2 dehydrogenase